MTRYLLSILTFLYAGFVLCWAGPSAGADDARSALEEVKSNVSLHRLSNGMRVLLYRRGYAPVFSGAISVRVGGSDERLGSTGISHMLEHMAFKGTERIGTKDYAREKPLLAELEVIAAKSDRSAEDLRRWEEIESQLRELWIPDQYSREYEKRGAEGLNATTDNDQTRYFVSLPRGAFEFWCSMESERLLHPVMRQFYKERDVVLEERRMRFEDDPGGKLYENMVSAAFSVHPYRYPIIGYRADIQRLTASMALDLQRRYYVPSNIVVALVGDVQPEVDIAELERCFGRLPKGPEPERPAIPEPKQPGEKRIVVEERSSPELMVAYHKPNYPDRADPIITVMEEVLGGGRVSPLYRELVKKQRIAASVSTGQGPGDAYPNLLYISATPKAPATNHQLLVALDRVLTGFRASKPQAEALEMAKRTITVSYLHGLDSNLSLALALSQSELILGDWRHLFSWLDQALAVTAEEVQQAAQTYLQDSNRTVAFLESAAGRK